MEACTAEAVSSRSFFTLVRIREAYHRGFREWRSAVLVAATALVSGYLLYAPLGLTLHGTPIQFYTAAIYCAVIGTTALLTFAFAPRLGSMTRAAAASRLAFATCVYLYPEPGLQIAAHPFANATVVIGGAAVLCWTVRICKRRIHEGGLGVPVG